MKHFFFSLLRNATEHNSTKDLKCNNVKKFLFVGEQTDFTSTKLRRNTFELKKKKKKKKKSRATDPFFLGGGGGGAGREGHVTVNTTVFLFFFCLKKNICKTFCRSNI